MSSGVLLVIRAVHSASEIWISNFMNIVNGASSIIPISDNGGSSSELIRVFGGPGIGDVRSTSLLLPETQSFHLTGPQSPCRSFDYPKE